MTIKVSDILSVTKRVTKNWTKQRKAEERGRRTSDSRDDYLSDRVCFTEVAEDILPAAYQHASGGGKYSVSKRQLFYASREAFREETGREIGWQYFSNTLLIQYINRHPETESWKITADPRGTLTIPNAGYDVSIPCGTLQIEEYMREAKQLCDPFALAPQLPVVWPSHAAGQRFQGLLYIEKEGFDPILEEARIAERFDLAILSNKGQSVVATRRLIDDICRVDGGIPLFVAHDHDKAGFEISQRLTTVSEWAEETDRVAYRFKNKIRVIDLGLRLVDVEKYALQRERFEFRGRFASDSICTPDEMAFLRSGWRVELNAFTSPQFIEWLIEKLSEYLPQRLVPADDVLEAAYRRALAVAEINHNIRDVSAAAIENAKSARIPKGLRRKLQDSLNGSSEAWDQVLYAIAESKLNRNRE